MEKRKRIAGIIIKNGKLLLLKGKKYEFLWTPGGRVDENETDEECLKRELKEELNVDLVSMKFFKEYEKEFYFDPSIKSQQMTYLVDVKGEVNPRAEIESAFWLTKEEYLNKKYNTKIEDNVIGDLIKENIW